MKRRDFITLLGGAAVFAPLAAHAQETGRARRIAILTGSAVTDPNNQVWIAAFKRGLEALGWNEGRNILIEHRGAAGDISRAQALIKELLQWQPEVIYTTNTPMAAAILQENRTIPIVFANISDPVGSGLVPSLASPGGNATGFTNFEFGIGGKWLEILRDLAPDLKRASLIFNPAAATYASGYIRSFETAAGSFAVRPTVAPINSVADVEQAFEAQAREPGGSAIVVPDIFNVSNRHSIIASSARHRLPVVYPYPVMAADGGLIAYGPDISDMYRRAAAYVDRILRGAKPGDLPVQQPTEFELIINLKTARAFGLTVPLSLQSRADEVIE